MIDLDNIGGRIYSPSIKYKQYPIGEYLNQVLPTMKAVEEKKIQYWYQGTCWVLGVPGSSQCVSLGFAHAIESASIYNRKPYEDLTTVKPRLNIDAHYHLAQQLDRWPGEEPVYAGTSTLGGALAAMQMGWLTGFSWAHNVNDIIQAVLHVGPVVFGSLWFDGMANPDRTGYVNVQGNVLGGHTSLIDGVNTETRWFRTKNTFGRDFGANGNTYISFDDMAMLLRINGEACLPHVVSFPRK